jgi:hypothetical protein
MHMQAVLSEAIDIEVASWSSGPADHACVMW